MSPKLRISRKTLIIGISALVILGGTGVAAAVIANQNSAGAKPEASPSSTPTPTPTPTPVPTPATIEPAAISQGAVANWSLASRASLAGVLPRVGDAAEGEISISIDAPVVAEAATALASTIAVTPATEYTLTAMVRVPSEDLVEVPAEVRVGTTTLPMPELNADWQEITTTYTTGAAESSVDLSVVVTEPVRGLAVDSVSLVDEDGADVILNGSFEAVDAPFGIRNDSLILQQRTATLAVKLAAGDAMWSAKAADGSEVAAGIVSITDQLSPVRLEGLGQGYYQVTVTDATGGNITAPVGIIDMPTFYVPTDTRFGTHVHAAKELARDATPSAAALGLGIIRLGDNWQVTEPAPGEFHWNEPFAQAMGEATVNGMDKMIVVGRTNKAYDGGMPPSSGGALEAYSRYSAALVEHYDLQAIEVYNEWNIPSFNKGCRTGGCYEPVLRAGYEGAKSVDPNIPVIGGVTGNFDRGFFQQLWNAGGINSLDAISFHPYQTMAYAEHLAGLVDEARADMSGHGAEKPVWITELGWSSKTGDVSLEEQGEMLVRSEITALADGVERYFWYDLVNDKTDRADHEGNFGLFTQRVDGLAAYPPKPSGYTQALLIAKLAGATYTEPDETPGVYSHMFSGAGSEELHFAWSTAGDATAEYSASGTITATNTRGEVATYEPVDGIVSVPVSSTPVIIAGEFKAGTSPEPSPSETPEDEDK
ncbi:glycosyl hydrolase [Microbacterium sp. A84]|uniref:glycosyl hydrolase n=1 Tax=Microbacterium sp. A84 TaxID=3450715 RepID=UPI003F43C4E5